MRITKEITADNELCVYMDGKLIYKRWFNTGQSKIFDVMAYDKYTYASYSDFDAENSTHLIRVKAKIRLLRQEDNRRTMGVKSGYRPNHVFERLDTGEAKEMFMGDLQFDDWEWLKLGKEYEVVVRFLLHQRIERFLYPGQKWWLQEGPWIVGEGEVLGVVQQA